MNSSKSWASYYYYFYFFFQKLNLTSECIILIWKTFCTTTSDEYYLELNIRFKQLKLIVCLKQWNKKQSTRSRMILCHIVLLTRLFT